MRRILALALVVICLLDATPPANGQTSANTEKPLIELLQQIAATRNITFSYNPRLLRGITVQPPASSVALAQVFEHLSARVPIEFSLVSGSNYAISPIRKPLTFRVFDSRDKTPIELIYVTINQKKQVYLIPQNGLYTLDHSFPSDSLEVRTSFYSPINTTAGQIAKNDHKVYLAQDTVNLGEVTVLSYLTSGVNSFLGDHHLEVDMSQLGLIAGETDGDVFQVLQAIPGIRSPNGKPGSLNFRGSPFNQNLTLFDDIPIYHTGHFFGTFSPYNPGIVDRIAVYRGPLPARYGGRVGGLIDVQTSDRVPDSTRTEVMINTVNAGLELETPVKPGIGFYLSYRTNYPIDYLSPKLKAYRDLNFQGSRISTTKLQEPGHSLEQLDIRFRDFNTRLVFEPGKKHKVALSYLHIDNELNYELDVPRLEENQQHFSSLDNNGVSLKWRSLWSENFNSELIYSSSSFRLFEDREHQRGQGVEREIVNNNIDDNRFHALFNIAAGKSTRLTFGYEYKKQQVVFNQTQTGPNADPSELRTGSGTINSVHASIEKQIASKWITNFGLHTDFFSQTNQQFFDPRLSLTYLATKHLFFKGSAGRAHQYIRQSFGNDFDDFRVGNQFWVLVNRDEQVVEGTQFMLGALYEKSDWLFDLELYSHEVRNISQPGPVDGQQRTPDLLGDLATIGADLLIKKRWTGFETWLSYSWGNTDEKFNPETGYFAAYYDQRHVMNVKWLYPHERWSLALSWSLMSGVPVRLPPQDEIENPDGPDVLNVSYEGRFPMQHQMDLSATYQFTKPDAAWKGIIGFSVLNLYDRRNVINIFQENVNVNDAIRYGLGFAPNLQIKLIF